MQCIASGTGLRRPLWCLQGAAGAPQGALYDPYDSATPYRQGAQDDHALHAALRRSLADQQRGSSDAEEHLRSAIAASLEVSHLLSCVSSYILSVLCCAKFQSLRWSPFNVPNTAASGNLLLEAISCCSLSLALGDEAHAVKSGVVPTGGEAALGSGAVHGGASFSAQACPSAVPGQEEEPPTSTQGGQ